MKVHKREIERIIVRGSPGEKSDILDYVYDNGYKVTRCGPRRISATRVDPNKYEVVAEREKNNHLFLRFFFDFFQNILYFIYGGNIKGEKMRRGKQDKVRRRKSAEECVQERAKRTDDQQLAKLDAEGWAASRERARLHSRILREKKNDK